MVMEHLSLSKRVHFSIELKRFAAYYRVYADFGSLSKFSSWSYLWAICESTEPSLAGQTLPRAAGRVWPARLDRTSMEPHFLLALARLEQLSFDRTRFSRETAPGEPVG